MHEQLKLLVILQDLDTMIRESSDPEKLKEMKTIGFEIQGIEKLRTARAKLAEGIEKPYLSLYERVAKRHGRAVVPVEDRTCLGCFQNVPPSFFSEISADRPVKVCENCGRILYFVTR
jgi:predicted  nucleic acid-binding Zn-ribbon protein